MGDVVKDLFEKTNPFAYEILGFRAQDQAEKQARRAESQARKAAEQAAEQARGEALNLQTQQERERLLAEAAEQKQEQTKTPEVAIEEGETAAERRKKYTAQAVGGTGQAGPSVRI